MIFPLAGNVKIRQSLENVLREHRIPHAILIDGDTGTGRHTLAEYICMSAVCSGENIPCGECKGCSLTKLKNHPDIIKISPQKGKKGISVDQIRELITDAYIKPHMSQKKVYIIDPAEGLTEQCQNTLLKILEEPPSQTIFVLIAENKSAFLETVISRCQVITLNVPTLEEGKAYLSAATDFKADDIENALKESRNNIGNALSLLTGKTDSKTDAAAREFLGFALRGDTFEMLSVLAPFEKNRPETGQLFSVLKLLTAEEIRKKPNGIRASELMKFYDELICLEETLLTNINLPLLFTDLVAVAKRCLG